MVSLVVKAKLSMCRNIFSNIWELDPTLAIDLKMASFFIHKIIYRLIAIDIFFFIRAYLLDLRYCNSHFCRVWPVQLLHDNEFLFKIFDNHVLGWESVSFKFEWVAAER